MNDASSMPWLRRKVNRWMSARISHLVGLPLPDTQCGFRLVNLVACRTVDLQSSHFEIESEMLVKFIVAGYPVQFVPVHVIYRTERSKICPWRDTLRWFGWWTSARLWYRSRAARSNPGLRRANQPSV